MVNVEYTNAFLKEWEGPSTVPQKPSRVPYGTSIYYFCASDFPFFFGPQRICYTLVVEPDSNRIGVIEKGIFLPWLNRLWM